MREGNAVYSATKWGVGAFSEGLRLEVEKNHIRVTLIEPGVVATEMQRSIKDQAPADEALAWIRSVTPLQGEDIAAAIVYAVTQPLHVDVNELLTRPTEQAC